MKKTILRLKEWTALMFIFLSSHSFAQVEFELINGAQKMLSAENFEFNIHEDDSASLQVEDVQEFSMYYLHANETPYWRYFPEANLAMTADFIEFDYFVKDESGTFQLGSISPNFQEGIGKIRTFSPKIKVASDQKMEVDKGSFSVSKTIYYPYFTLSQGIETKVSYLGEKNLQLSTTDSVYHTHLYLEQSYYTDTYTTVNGQVYQNQSDSTFIFIEASSGKRLLTVNYARSYNTAKPRSGQDMVVYNEITSEEKTFSNRILIDVNYMSNALNFDTRSWSDKTKITIYSTAKKKALVKLKYTRPKNEKDKPYIVELPDDISGAVIRVEVKSQKEKAVQIDILTPFLLQM